MSEISQTCACTTLAAPAGSLILASVSCNTHILKIHVLARPVLGSVQHLLGRHLLLLPHTPKQASGWMSYSLLFKFKAPLHNKNRRIYDARS